MVLIIFIVGDDYEIKGLIASGLYEFQFKSIPSKEKTETKNLTVLLLPDQPEIIIQNVEGSNLRIKWFRKTEDVLRGTIDHYELKYYYVSYH